MVVISQINFRKVLNSHAELTTEFTLTTADGRQGVGASPKGETTSIYEDQRIAISPETIVGRLGEDGVVGREWTQEGFDDYLQQRVGQLGRNNAYSLSLAFLNASCLGAPANHQSTQPVSRPAAPRLCCNLLNGGWHAYTNPVLSDFPEYLLVARSHDVRQVVQQHNQIQRMVREELAKLPKTMVSGNPVSQFRTADNRECMDFLLQICDRLGYSDQFDLMIDASAGDLWTDRGYRLAITDESVHSTEAFREYWADIIQQYPLRFLEDPFREEDPDSWRHLTTSQTTCSVIGDNFYSSDAQRIRHGAACQHTHGVILKPNQAGTVSAIRRAVEAALRCKQIAITSHRSISTESTFLSTLSCEYSVPYIKIGPLLTDYSSVLRLNAILRLTT
jgi:enolase